MAVAEPSVQLWPWSTKRYQKCRGLSQSLEYSSGGSKSMACYYSAKERSLQCSRWWLCLARLGTSRSRHRATSAFALFLRRCPSGTSLHFYAVNSVSHQLEIARINQIAHQISLVPPPANPAAPNPCSFPPSPSPLIRCSRRLASKAELTGGRKV
jgi:hypothetical protein